MCTPWLFKSLMATGERHNINAIRCYILWDSLVGLAKPWIRVIGMVISLTSVEPGVPVDQSALRKGHSIMI